MAALSSAWAIVHEMCVVFGAITPPRIFLGVEELLSCGYFSYYCLRKDRLFFSTWSPNVVALRALFSIPRSDLVILVEFVTTCMAQRLMTIDGGISLTELLTTYPNTPFVSFRPKSLVLHIVAIS